METVVNVKSKKKYLTAQRISLIAIFVAIMCVCSWISVPSPFNPGVPFTLQTLGIILAGLVLSPAEAIFASLCYLLLGLCGLPVFANFSTLYSGIGSPAGGYIIGFYIAPPILALAKKAIFKITDKKSKSKPGKNITHIMVYLILGIILATLLIDIPGVIQGMIITKMPLGVAIIPFALSFLPTDILKAVAAAFIAEALEKPYKKLFKNNN